MTAKRSCSRAPSPARPARPPLARPVICTGSILRRQKDGSIAWWLTVDFGPLVKQPYVKRSADLFDMFVGVKGGVGTVSIKSAEQDGDAITFMFAKPLCVGETTFFFGLAAEKAPQSVSAGVLGYGSPPYHGVDARGPAH